MESRALQSKQDEVFRAAQEADASKVRVFQQVSTCTLKYADFLNLLLLILHHHNLNFHTRKL